MDHEAKHLEVVSTNRGWLGNQFEPRYTKNTIWNFLAERPIIEGVAKKTSKFKSVPERCV